ncbi:MAG: hypothetical protein ACLR6B_13095 [Blautia sp.]
MIRHMDVYDKTESRMKRKYKRRHDGLIAQRGDTVDPDPTVISVSGVPVAIFLDTMRSILQWK